MGNTFDILDKYIDEHIDEILDIINQELKRYITSIALFPYGDKVLYPIKPIKFSIDDNEHMCHNTFNKWSWTKFKNGVIKIDERRV